MSAFTFDAFAFPTFACLQALLIGLVGAVWRRVADENRRRDRDTERSRIGWESHVDTLNISRAIWRNRKSVTPVVVVITLSLGWLFFLRPPTYVLDSSILVTPPPAVGAVSVNSRRAGGVSDNPLARAYDPTVVIALVSLAITSDQGREVIKAAGGDEHFAVKQDSRYGAATPFVDIHVSGSTPAEVIKSQGIVVQEFMRELQRIQDRDNVSPEYRITARVAADGWEPSPRITDRVQHFLAIMMLGLFGVFAATSIPDAIRLARQQALVND